MKKPQFAFRFLIGLVAAIALSFCTVTTMTGCGPSNPTEDQLDRVPNVPPSDRANKSGPPKAR